MRIWQWNPQHSSVKWHVARSRCELLGVASVPEPLQRTRRVGSIPDVVVQFWWKNPRAYEEDAMDAMMNRGLETEKGPLSTTRPAFGVLDPSIVFQKADTPRRHQ